MDRRLILGLALVALVGSVGITVFGSKFGLGGAATVSPDASITAGTVPTGTPPASAAPDAAAPPGTGPAATCMGTSQLIAERAKAADTGFPVPVEWIGLGPADETFFTLSDVAPQIMIDPAGSASIAIGLQYISGTGDRYALTGGSLNLAYDPATGRVSGSLDTGYGKNSNRATTDTVRSTFDGLYTRPATPGATGLFEGAITHVDRETYRFKVQMSEESWVLLSDRACATPRPTDTP